MQDLLKSLSTAENISSVNDKLSDMESIFKLQKMYEMENEEKELEEKLKKLGYIGWKKFFKENFLIIYYQKILKILLVFRIQLWNILLIRV